jgi:tRNA(fMet)-specific endonuclease VapC
MNWLLDTNACIRYLNGRSPALKAKLEAVPATQLCVCSVVKAELYFGAARSRDPDKTIADQRVFLSRFRSLPFDDAAAESYAKIRSDLTQRGQLIGPNDLLIAAICLAHDVTLITHNVAEFGRIDGLSCEDWES